MRTVNILATNNCVGSSLTGVIDFLQFCNAFWVHLHPHGSEELFAHRIYAAHGETITFSNGIRIDALPLSDYQPADCEFLVSAFAHKSENMNQFLAESQSFNAILQRAHAQEKLIASYCTGTFGLAAAGVLDNGKATTVWWMKNLFAERFPKVSISLDELVVTQDNVITGGATTSYFNVCMQILERLSNPIFAMRMSKLLLLDKHRLSQQAFIDTSFVLNNQDALVEKIQDWMMEHFTEHVSLDELCEKFAVSKRTLIRRFKKASGETPLNYLQKIRVEKAKHYLETSNLPIERIVEKVGYEDTASFRKLFASQTQLSPKAYRERFTYVSLDDAACC